MAKYQNVSTPRFYVDYFQWTLATKTQGNQFLGRYSGEDGNGTDYLLSLPVSEKSALEKLFYLDPTYSYTYNYGDTSPRWLSINLELQNNDHFNIDYCMILNHNFQTQYTTPRLFHISYDQTLSSKEVTNYVGDVNYSNNSKPPYDGWSLFSFEKDNTDSNEIQCLLLRFGHNTDNNNTRDVRMGAISIGKKYDMPVAPDLQLTMEKQYGGVQKLSTINGGEISNYNYSQPPSWSNLEPWGLSKAEDVENNIYKSSRIEPKEARRSGRRVWNLKFSYISDSKLMADIEMLNFSNLPDNHSYEYFLGKQTNSDDRFFSDFMHKTLGGNLRFVFQPDNTNFDPDGFAICVLDQDSISVKQVAHNTYDISLKIMEVW